MTLAEEPAIERINHETPPSDFRPIFGFMLMGGPLNGALVRDIRLANELAQRGFTVHVWWTMDSYNRLPLHENIQQHWLLHAFRYMGNGGRGIKDWLGRLATRFYPDKRRIHVMQKRPHRIEQVMCGLLRQIAGGVENDKPVLDRFVRELTEAGVTHLMPMLSALAPWAAAAQKRVPHRMKYLVTFQGYELYSIYARNGGFEQELYAQLRSAVEHSDFPAIAVSADYAERVEEEIGVPLQAMVPIPPGIPTPPSVDREAAKKHIAEAFPRYNPDEPLVTFLGRRDTEKGIDLLLYAAAILRRRGVKFQLAICGPTLFGDRYRHVCLEIADSLRCPVFWSNLVGEKTREALLAGSTCLVYPSIHREPFGMVPVEALSHGTPAIVPDLGGVTGAISARGESGGLVFDSWCSGDLADKIEKMVLDKELWKQFAEASPRVAEYYSVANLADRVLAHLELAPAITKAAA